MSEAFLVYITGSSWTGKTEVQAELKKRGEIAFGDDELAGYRHKKTQQFIRASPYDKTDWQWWLPADGVLELKKTHKGRTVFVCSVTKNDNELASIFDLVVGLLTTEEAIKKRVEADPNRKNPFGLCDDEMKGILAGLSDFKNKYEDRGVRVIDTSNLEVSEVARQILEIVKQKKGP